MNEVVLGVVDQLQALTPSVAESSTKIRHINTKRGEAARVLTRKVANDLTQRVDAYCKCMTSANDDFQLVIWNTSNSFQAVIQFQQNIESDWVDALIDQLAQVRNLIQRSEQAKPSLTGFADSIDSVPNLERGLNQSLKREALETRRMVDNLEQLESSVRRAIEVGDDIVKRHRDSGE